MDMHLTLLIPGRWGYLQTGSGVPQDILPLISRSINLEYCSIICRDAFNITTPSDVDAINKYGGFDITYPRLAFIDGEADPWRPATPHSDKARPRPNTVERPFILIKGAVHHCESIHPLSIILKLHPDGGYDTDTWVCV